ncbi:muscarinic acetylcholine receptor M4 [Biomphalaria pfeifferi]|uniref:Muscarinic acetylcholine receptor M4 n=1 Tax=Biomphalaria pfeifferi TaxID=112525 RepID=A0AAD8F0P1_BIOPF|nr:muscarinic acetylcholine receptor M4 [Biomphalaria pfeifferi]
MENNWIEGTKKTYISDEVLEYFDIVINISLHGMLSAFGVMSNIVNMVIFVKLKLKNSMSLGLFALSLTDFYVTLFKLASSLSNLVQILYPDSPVDPMMICGYLFNLSYVFYLVSCWITTMLSIERCFCVVSPFKVRQTFTRGRCLTIIILIYVVHISIHLPIFFSTQIKWVAVQIEDNSTLSDIHIQKLVLDDNSAWWETLSDIVVGTTLSLLSQVLLVISTIWMIVCLMTSSKIRKLPAHDTRVTNSRNENKVTKSLDHTLSQKEKRMVTTVLWLSIILSASNIPRFITTFVHHTVPGMDVGAYENLDKILWDISYLVVTTSCCFNILIYIRLNSSYANKLSGFLS